MKKAIILLLTFAVLFIAGCSDHGIQNEINDNSMNTILEVDNAMKPELNHAKMISTKPLHSISETAKKDETVIVNNKELSLKYSETLYYPIGGKNVHLYHVDGDKSKTVLVDDNGAINAILYKYTTLCISPTASPDEVLELLKPEISKITDIAYYENVKIPERVTVLFMRSNGRKICNVPT